MTMGKDDSSVGLKPSLEVSGGFFNTIHDLRSLIATACRDNVQPQAILAAQQLGASLIIDSQLYSDAIECLGGNDSVRVESAKVLVGLTSGGTKQLVREDSSLLTAFVLCAACKPCYIDEEIGALLFEMMSSQGILKHSPVSTAQLHQLVKQLSGHAETIAPVDLMEDIAAKVAEFNPAHGMFTRLPTRVLSSLLSQLFEHLRDESVREITISGHNHGVWLSTTLIWLIGDDACLEMDKQHIRGPIRSRVTISLLSTTEEQWRLSAWTQGAQPASYTYPHDWDELDLPYRLPTRTFKRYLDQHYWGHIIAGELRLKVGELTGRIVEALILLASERGKVYRLKTCCSPYTHCCGARLDQLATDEWLSSCGNMSERYGWKVPINGIKSLYDLLALDLDAKPHASRPIVELTVRAVCRKHIINEVGHAHWVDWILSPAIYIAADAAVTSACRFMNGHRYIDTLSSSHFDNAEKLYFSLITLGLELMEFRRSALMHALPGIYIKDHDDLIVSNNGYVAGLSILWKLSTLQQDAMCIRVCKGEIRQDDVVYDRVQEDPYSSFLPADNLEKINIENIGTVERPRWRFGNLLPRQRFELVTTVTVTSTALRIRPSLLEAGSSADSLVRHKVSWIAAANILAAATHLGQGFELFPEQEQQMMERLSQKSRSMPIFSCPIPASPEILDSTKVILQAQHDPTLQFFAAGLCNDMGDRCCAIIVRHEAPLVQCITKADSIRAEWIILG